MKKFETRSAYVEDEKHDSYIQSMADDGWEPWHMEGAHACNGTVSGFRVYFKREIVEAGALPPEEDEVDDEAPVKQPHLGTMNVEVCERGEPWRKIVPITPDPRMIVAGAVALEIDDQPLEYLTQTAEDVWAAMIEHAPERE